MTLPAETLTEFVAAIWRGLATPAADAWRVAEALVEANLAGHDSHGVIRLPQWYDHLRQGRLRPGAPINVVRETMATALVDGGWNFGILAADRALDLACEKAAVAGVASVGLRASHHVGRLADYCRRGAEAGFVVSMVANNHGAAAVVTPWGGREARLSTCPMAYAFPRPAAPPVVVDVTTSVAPEGKVRVLRNRGEQAPPGWLLDAGGEPTRDPAVLYQQPRGALLPLGGEVGHKGYGLGLAVELLSGAMTGAGCTSLPAPPVYGNAVCLTVWQIEAMVDRVEYDRNIESLIGQIKSCPRRPGCDEILLPGERADRSRQQRLYSGIPLDRETWRQVVQVAEAAGVVPPAVADC